MKFTTFSIVTGTSTCDACCPFCVSHFTPKNGVSSKQPEVNWRNFEKAARLAQQAGVMTAMMTGKGEPTLFPGQVTDYLKALQKYNFPLLEIQSNGLNAGRGKLDAYLQEWYNLGLTTFAISVVHYKAERNKEVYTPRGEYIDLPALIAKLHATGIAVRLAVVLVKGYLDTPELLDEMIQFARDHKVEQLTFRPVNQTDKPANNNPKDLGIYDWTTHNRIPKEQVEVLQNYIAAKGKALMHLPHGATIYDVEGQNVCMTNSLTVNTNQDELRQLIYFPDGRLTYDWQFAGARII